MRPLRVLLCAAAVALGAAAPAAADVVDDNLAAVARSAGDVVVFARGADEAVYVREGVDGTWKSIGGRATSGPAAAVRPDGTIDVYVRGIDDAIHHAFKPKGGDWSPWESLGGVASSGPGTTARVGTDTLDLFVSGTNRGLHHKTWNPRDGWSGWRSLGGEIFGAPSPVSRKTGWLDVYVRGAQNGIFNKSYTNGAWTEYDPVGGATLSAPSAITRANGNLDVFVRGTDKALHQRFFIEGQGYSEWFRVDPRPMTSGPAAVADGPDRVHVFARDGAEVFVKSFTAGQGWAAWRGIGPVAAPRAEPAPQPAPQPAPPPPPPPAPVQGGTVQLGTGLRCTPRGDKVMVSVKVRKRPGRAKPQVRRVVFFYRKGKGKVARTDRKAPYRRGLPVNLEPGRYKAYARIYYKRPGKKELGRKTVFRRFVVCA